MSPANLISIALLALILLTLPQWRYTRIWGGTYTPTAVLGFMLAAHAYTILRAG